MFALGFLRTFAVALVTLFATLACAGDEVNGGTESQAVCAPVAPTECPDAAPKYSDVAPIFAERCASCHNTAPGAPWPLDNYAHVADWAYVIHDELMGCLMPPRDSGVAMTPEERQLILLWIRCKYPE